MSGFFCVLDLEINNCHFYTMKINDWFNNGCNYEEGVAIYSSLKTSKINLIRLFKNKTASSYLEKLKYELSKYKETEVVLNTTFKVVSTDVKTASSPGPIITPIIEAPLYKQKLIRDYPIALHPVYIQQKNDYAIACSLKIQLNNITADEENNDEALNICLQIDRLFDAIELAWKQLDHYTDTKTILEINTNDFSALSPAQLLQRRNNYRSNLTKANKHLKVMQSKEAVSIADKTKLEVKTEKQLKKIIQLEENIQSLNNLIN
jgi:hypothetical protein